jgi:hypothetical protein
MPISLLLKKLLSPVVFPVDHGALPTPKAIPRRDARLIPAKRLSMRLGMMSVRS